ncbi:unnamed protein product [Lactuca saligna]|uniref:Uncharacterized protein n=1 Tax=Lactuca saligna TaxID=75948 RepID=A0AA35ZLK7_LACSI|nr:unnamed protein product [Lactuca saligna]
MLNETFNKEEDNSKLILEIEDQLERIMEQLKQQPPGKPSHTTQVNEVSFLCINSIMDNPTPPELEVVVEDDVPLIDNDTQSMFEIKEVVIELEKYNKALHELEASKVGERFVAANTIPYPTTFKKKTDPQLLLMESKILAKYKQPSIIIDHPFLETIYAHISCQEGVINVTFVSHKLRVLFFGPTNDPPISGDLVLINTIDDYVYEHTANMLNGTAHNLEIILSSNRSKASDDCMS